MKFLVTGGSGYLGTYLINYLIKKSHKIFNIDLNDSDIKSIVTKKIDVQDYLSLKKIFDENKIDIVIHNTAKVPITKNKKEFFKTNVEGTKNMLELSKKYNIKKFVYISSSAVYGIPLTLPILEADKKIPVEAYGLSKKQAEDLCFKYFNDLNISIIRPRTIIGGNRFGIFSILFDWISNDYKVPVINNGENLYQFVDIDDLVEAIYLSVHYQSSDDFNIGADKYFTIRELLQSLINTNNSKSIIKDISNSMIFKIGDILQKKNLIPLQDYHFKAYGHSIYFDNTKAKEKLSWYPKKDNLQSLQESYQMYLDENFISNNKSTHQKKIKDFLLRYATYLI